MIPVGVLSVLAGLANIVGGWLTLSAAFSREQLEQLVALGAGFLLGGALLSMLPHAVAHSPDGGLFAAVGYLGLFALRRLTAAPGHDGECGPIAASAWAATLAMAVHGFFDGGALGVASLADGRVAVMAFLAVFLHKVPEGFSLGALVVASTGSRRLAFMATVFTGLATVCGALAASVWAESAHLPQGALLGIAAGTFLYVGSADMLPSLPRKPVYTFLVLAGAGLVYLLAGIGGHRH